MERLFLLAKIERGLQQADADELIPREKVKEGEFRGGGIPGTPYLFRSDQEAQERAGFFPAWAHSRR